MEDIQAIVQNSRDFFEKHNLPSWSKTLQGDWQITEQGRKLWKKARKFNLTQALSFPDFATQMQEIDTVIEEMALKPVEGIAVNAQLSKTYISDNWSKEASGKVYQRMTKLGAREKGPYLLFYNLLEIAAETVGKKGNQIARLFRKNRWSGFTSPELLSVQRLWREQKAAQGIKEGDRELDQYFWVWLVDSADENSCCAALYSLHSVSMYGCKVGSSNKNRGANITVILPL